MKDLEDWAAVQKVYKQTKSKRATAKILSISRNTVKRLLDMTEPPVYRRTEYSSKIDEYKERLHNSECRKTGVSAAFVSYVVVTAAFSPDSLTLHHAHTIKQLIPAAFSFFSVFSAFLRSV